MILGYDTVKKHRVRSHNAEDINRESSSLEQLENMQSDDQKLIIEKRSGIRLRGPSKFRTSQSLVCIEDRTQ